MPRILALALFLALPLYHLVAQDPPVAPSWTEFVEARRNGTQPLLPDFSFAGYHFSERELPDVADWKRFVVTDYGATPDDDGYDDAGIQAAIDAAEASDGPAVVFFPPGRFIVSDDNDIDNFIAVGRSHLVLKGSGSGEGGTEIFMDRMRVKNGHWQFVFQPENPDNSTLTRLAEPALRNDYTVTVADAGGLSAGQTVTIRHNSVPFAHAHYGALAFSPRWTRLFNESEGMALHENHLIEKVEGNRVTFKNPVQTDLPLLDRAYNIRRMATLEEVGVEDILFVGNWPSVGEVFVHHKNDVHDYAWNALQFKGVQNAWLRNCEFRDWNQVMDIRESLAVTVQDVIISGKAAHASFITRSSYGLLIKDCEDRTGSVSVSSVVPPMQHGPGVGFSGVNTVYLRYKAGFNQSLDAHSGHPFASLYDNIDGGNYRRNGGPERFYPNHGRHLVLWNHRHDNAGTDITYDFWSLERRRLHTFAEPYFIGFQPDGDVTFIGEGLDELRGLEVAPKSLFEAQLQLRLEGTDIVSNRPPLIADFRVNVFPNPSSGHFTAVADEPLTTVRVFRMNGQEIAVPIDRLNERNVLLRTDHLPAGLYLLQLTTDRGLAYRRLIKQ